MSRALGAIAADTQTGYTNAIRATECLVALDDLPPEDLARPAYQAAAQTFALLHVADSIECLTTQLAMALLPLEGPGGRR